MHGADKGPAARRSRACACQQDCAIEEACLGKPYHGHVLNAQLEQTSDLLQDLGRSSKQVIVDPGYRGVNADNPDVQIIHRGKYKSLTQREKHLLERRQAIEPVILHTKSDHRMDRRRLPGARGDALHALSCAARYDIHCCCGRSSVSTRADFFPFSRL